MEATLDQFGRIVIPKKLRETFIFTLDLPYVSWKARRGFC